MMSAHIMVVLIIMIVMTASVLRARYKAMGSVQKRGDDVEDARLKEELTRLRDRLAVLERIATEKENSLAQEIERLRDR